MRSCIMFIVPVQFMFIKMAECILSWNIAITKIKVNMPHTRRIFSTCLQNAKG